MGSLIFCKLERLFMTNINSRARFTAAAGIAAAAAVGSLLLAPASPAAAFQQEWSGSAAKRSSRDFLPVSTSLTVGVKSCSSSSDVYAKLIQTSGSVSKGPTDRYPANGLWNGGSTFTVKVGTAYYLQWLSVTGVKTGCQGVQAFVTQ
jgi:hypothetical protein